MEDEESALERARRQYEEAAETANRMLAYAYEEAFRQYNLFLGPYREAYYDAIEEAGKEHMA